MVVVVWAVVVVYVRVVVCVHEQKADVMHVDFIFSLCLLLVLLSLSFSPSFLLSCVLVTGSLHRLRSRRLIRDLSTFHNMLRRR